jgi:hypothetical protein
MIQIIRIILCAIASFIYIFLYVSCMILGIMPWKIAPVEEDQFIKDMWKWLD